tara:strand:- start:548 stop:862 length:315 start_codon:yes stop_codon:yes gene_type:complete
MKLTMNEKKKNIKFTILNLMDKPRWKKMKCVCNHNSVETEFPIFNCLHCKFQSQEMKLPRSPFKISLTSSDRNGKTKSEIVTCNKIKINRGDKYQEIIGWFNLV